MANTITNESSPGKWKINRRLLPTKAISFIKCGAESVWFRFSRLYMRKIGLTPSESGIIGCALPFVQFVCSPLFGAIADKYRKHKLTVISACVLTTVLMISVLFVPARNRETNKEHGTIFCNGSINNIVGLDFLNGRYVTYNISRFNDLYETASNLCDIPCKVLKEKFSTNSSTNMAVGFIQTNPVSYRFLIPCRHKTISFLCTNMSTYDFNNDSAIYRTDVNGTGQRNEDVNMNREEVHLGLLSNAELLKSRICKEEFALQCQKSCSDNELSKNSFDYTFWAFFSIYAAGSIVYSCISGITDAMIYSILGDNWAGWGKQRLWGSVAGVIGGVSTTWILVANSKNSSDIPYEICFYIFGAGLIGSAICVFMLKLQKISRVKNIWKESLALINNFASISLFINVTLFGIYMGVINGYLYWYLVDQQDGSSTEASKQIILGLMISLDGLFEIPLFYLSGRIIQFLGHIPCMVLVAATFGIRMLLYSFIRNPWYVLLIIPLNSLSYGLVLATSSSYVSLISPPGLGAISQCIVGGLFDGIGSGIGYLLTGFLFEIFGGVWTFRFYAFTAFGFVVPFIVAQWCILRKRVAKCNEEYDVVSSRDNANHHVSDKL